MSAGFDEMLRFPLIDALLGRRSRRFFMGAEIPDGVFQYRSKHDPVPLSEAETLLVVTACGGNTSWHHMIQRAKRYAPHLSNYAGSAGGRTFPSAAGFHTSKTFFTDDSGLYLLDCRDVPAFDERAPDGTLDLNAIVEALRRHVHLVHEGRLRLPSQVPHVEAHNTWVVNQPGTLLVIPVGDLAQHVVLTLMYMLQNGMVLYDDIHGRPIPGIARFADLVDSLDDVWPITFVEQLALGELTAELSTSCYAGALMLQAMGLGGWMFDGIDPFSMMGASGDPSAPALGFDHQERDDWPYPNVTGKAGVLAATCPPNYPDMTAAVQVVCDRKFGKDGPFNPETPGPWKDSHRVRGAAQVHDDHFRRCIAHQANYVFETFGKFPATIPSTWCLTYLQAFHLDLEFYDRFYAPGAYLQTHADHMKRWHQDEDGGSPAARGRG
jgi:hypothetical protein